MVLFKIEKYKQYKIFQILKFLITLITILFHHQIKKLKTFTKVFKNWNKEDKEQWFHQYKIFLNFVKFKLKNLKKNYLKTKLV